jgi:RNA ligase (TIGR02306 family)
MRNLATIQIIKDIEDIPGKDRIGYVSFRKVEWRVIGDKTLTVGEKVVYVEYDSILPVNPAFEFLRKRCYNEKYRGFKIGAMRMAGVVSYGLILTRSNVQDLISDKQWDSLSEGDDLTEKLHIQKLEDEVSVVKIRKSPLRRFFDKLFGKKEIPPGFLPFISKSDETRAEVLPYLFDEKRKSREVYTTVKVDGQSGTFALHRGKFYAASRNQVLYAEKLSRALRELKPGRQEYYQKQGLTFLQMAAKYDAVRWMRDYFKTGYAIQFEQAGPKIQSNHLGLAALQIFIFNIFDIENRKYLNWDGIEGFSKKSGIPTVPFVEKTVFHWNTMDELYEYSKGVYDNGHPREGVVIRAYSGDYTPAAEEDMHAMWSFKVINPDYIT